LGRLWKQYSKNTGRSSKSDWRLCPEFADADCWLYVELTWPTFGKHPDSSDFFHDEVVHAYIVRDGTAVAAVRFEPWRGSVPLDEIKGKEK
jgi:hypothetical protein